jgi:hypothetical protein
MRSSRARDYKRTLGRVSRNVKKDKNLLPPRRDLQLEPLGRDSRRQDATCTRTATVASEILMLINIADEFGFKIKTFQHVLEGYKVAKEIARHGAGASIFAGLVGLQDRGLRRDSLQRRNHDARGRGVSMNSDSDERARRLNHRSGESDALGRI